jgi:hypothetical protein
MSLRKFIGIWIVLLITVAVSFGQRKAGINGASFLKVGVGARSVGMGSAVTTNTGDVEQIFWNPAGIALKDQQLQAVVSYNDWLAGIKQNSGAVSYNIRGVGTVAVGFITFGAANIPANRDPFNDPNTSSTFDYMDIAAQVSFARYVTDRLALGFTAKYISEKIDDMSVNAVAFDVGSLYNIGVMDWKIGARLNNIGSDITYYNYASSIPITFSMGSSIMPINTDAQKATVALDVVKQQDYLAYFNLGVEYEIENTLALRAGYKLNYSGVEDAGRTARNPVKTTIEGWSIGGGVHTSMSGYDIRFDYAYTGMELLNNVHRFSLHLGWK